MYWIVDPSTTDGNYDHDRVNVIYNCWSSRRVNIFEILIKLARDLCERQDILGYAMTDIPAHWGGLLWSFNWQKWSLLQTFVKKDCCSFSLNVIDHFLLGT